MNRFILIISFTILILFLSSIYSSDNRFNIESDVIIPVINKNARFFIGHGYMNQFESDLIQFEPREKKELVLQFTNAGTVHFACPLPGHFKKMRGKIFVEKK